MSYQFTDFQSEAQTCYAIHFWSSTKAAQIAAVAAALASDTRTHDRTIQTAASSALQIQPGNGRLTNDLSLLIDAGLAGNLSQSQMVAALGLVGGFATNPGQITAPSISSAATPPIVGTVLTATNGTWGNGTTGFTYQWQRDGVNIAAATASTYTLVSADVGANHRITCNVTATNATGSTAATPSNAITVP